MTILNWGGLFEFISTRMMAKTALQALVIAAVAMSAVAGPCSAGDVSITQVRSRFLGCGTGPMALEEQQCKLDTVGETWAFPTPPCPGRRCWDGTFDGGSHHRPCGRGCCPQFPSPAGDRCRNFTDCIFLNTSRPRPRGRAKLCTFCCPPPDAIPDPCPSLFAGWGVHRCC